MVPTAKRREREKKEGEEKQRTPEEGKKALTDESSSA